MRYEYYIGHLIVKLYECAFNDVKTAKMCGLCLNSVRQPLGNKIRVGQISAILPFPVQTLQFRLDNLHQLTIVTVNKIDSVGILKEVAVVKQAVEAEYSKRIESTGMDLKFPKTLVI